MFIKECGEYLSSKLNNNVRENVLVNDPPLQKLGNKDYDFCDIDYLCHMIGHHQI